MPVLTPPEVQNLGVEEDLEAISFTIRHYY